MDTLSLSAIPSELQWMHSPLAWNVDQGSQLTIVAGPKTDLFIDPSGASVTDNTPSTLFVPANGDFLFSAKVTVEFASMFDAGVLQIRDQADRWAKLCFEYSPQPKPMVVSVVTRGFSDDCNSTVIEGNATYLRIARIGSAFAFHYSLDGQFWNLVRYFTLGSLDNLHIGFSSQSPTGTKCSATFSEISYRLATLKDPRSGE